MISDEELKKALELYELTRPTPELVAMDRKYSRMRIGYLSRLWAGRALIALLCIGALSMASPRVRAAVSSWIINCLPGQSSYESRGQDAPDGGGDYALTWVPEDCQTKGVTKSVNGTDYRYVDADGYNLFFSYVHNMESGNAKLWLNVGTEELRTVTVNGRTADLYVEGNYTTLVWLSEDEGTLFQLQGHASVTDIIKMAESVKKTG